jgi:hypothetical protein
MLGKCGVMGTHKFSGYKWGSKCCATRCARNALYYNW